MLTSPKTPYEFFEVATSLRDGGLHLIGFEFDGTACFRKGTVDGPNAIRENSPGIESYSPYLNKDLEDLNDLFDLGNLVVPKTQDIDKDWMSATENFFSLTQNENFKNPRTKIITLGGEHSISYAPIVSHLKKYPNMVLLHLDAHADLRDGYEGHHYSHASIIRRVLDQFQEGHELIQYGIRSGTKEEYQWMRENKTLCISRDEFLEKVKSLSDERPIYLTLDLDYFDPGIFPGTGTPEPGGEDFHSFIKLLKILKNKNFIGADIVELSPPIDQTGNSDVFASKVVRETILALRAD